ncbi:hypothetical protein ACFPFX_07220 [Streptomyces mauvecolor]|uniref:Uncharacterized protein n=1 Tax=Streptomyces mauvecolor TaxID=58345 RepID=A0ABV9UHZ6_9ACTN
MSESTEAHPSPAKGPIPEWLNDLGRLHYFSKEEGDLLKSKVNGLSVGLDYVKLGLGVTALGLTAVKIDFTALKIDEKGIVLFGKQKVTWPHARDDKAKGESAEKAMTKRMDKIDARIREVSRLRTAAANNRDDKYLQKKFARDFGKLQKMQSKIEKAQQELKRVHAADESKKGNTRKLRDDESGDIARTAQAVQRLTVAIG